MDGPLPVVVETTQVWKSLAFGALVAGSISVGAMAQSAAGQIGGGIPCALAAQNNFNPAQQAQIQDFVAAAGANLVNQNPVVAQQARNDLLAPINCNGVTVAFRLKYGTALNPTLAPLVAPNQPAPVAINAMRIMGEVRSSESVRILQSGLSDPRPAVRFGATTAYGLLLGKPQNDTWPLRVAQRSRVLQDLQNALANESDAIVVEGIVQALTRVNDASMQVDAMTRLSRALAARRTNVPVGAANADVLNAWIRAYSKALFEVRGVLFNQGGGGANVRTLAIESSLLAGQSLALVRELMSDPTIEDDAAAQAQLRNIAVMADAVVVFAGPVLSVQVRSMEPGPIFNQGQPAFTSAIDGWIGQGGLLSQAPYSANPTDFE